MGVQARFFTREEVEAKFTFPENGGAHRMRFYRDEMLQGV
jgi:hypothetical protein